MRLHLFELHDLDWMPSPIRESVVEVLGTTMRWGGIVDALLPAFRGFLARTRATEILELCSGSGQPARLLLDRLRVTAPTPAHTTCIVLTDLRPRAALWESLCASREPHNDLTFIRDSVDATSIPDALGRGRPRLVLNAFHHFPPPLARAVLADAHRQQAGIFIAENFGRNPLGTLPCGLYGIPAAFANPLLTSRQRAAKALCTYVFPAIPLAVAWDGFVSSLRVYTDRDLHAMTRDLDGFQWQAGSFHYPPFGQGRFFYGVPRAANSHR